MSELWRCYRALPLGRQFVVEWAACAVVAAFWLVFLLGVAVGSGS